MLLRILLLLLVLLVVPTLYIYFAYVVRWTKHFWLRLLAFVPALLLAAYFYVVFRTDDLQAAHQAGVGRFMFVFLLVTVPLMLFTLLDALTALLALLARQLHAVDAPAPSSDVSTRSSETGLLRRWLRIFAMTVAFFSALMIVYGYVVGRRHYVVHHQTLYFQNLPERFDGYRIAFFSDLHIGTFADGHQQDVRTITELINRQSCDLVVFAGDLVNFDVRELDGYRPVLASIKAPDGVVAVMGNHDYPMYRRTMTLRQKTDFIRELAQLERLYGWKLLRNEHIVLRNGSDSIAVIGVENDGRPPFPSLGNLPKAAGGLQGVVQKNKNADHTFSILLSHDPTSWHRHVLPETNIDLTLSGHTHAGQFKLFGWSPVALVYDEWSGAYTEGFQMLNVSEGIGQILFPFRFGAWPELNVLTLKKL